MHKIIYVFFKVINRKTNKKKCVIAIGIMIIIYNNN